MCNVTQSCSKPSIWPKNGDTDLCCLSDIRWINYIRSDTGIGSNQSHLYTSPNYQKKKPAKLSEQPYNRARVGFIIILLHPNCDKLTFWNRAAAQHRHRVRCWNWPFSFGRSAVRQWSYQTFPSKIIRVNINQKWLSFSSVTPATSCIIYPANR